MGTTVMKNAAEEAESRGPMREQSLDRAAKRPKAVSYPTPPLSASALTPVFFGATPAFGIELSPLALPEAPGDATPWKLSPPSAPPPPPQQQQSQRLWRSSRRQQRVARARHFVCSSACRRAKLTPSIPARALVRQLHHQILRKGLAPSPLGASHAVG